MNFYDLEGRRWTKPLSAAALVSGKEHFFDGADSWQKMADLMIRVKGQWAAHFGGGYDNICMIKYLGEVVSAVLAGSRLLAIKFANGVELIDTFPGWLCSLEAIGKWLKLPKIKHDRKMLASLSYQELKDYNLRDVHIVAKGWDASVDYAESVGMDHKKTAGSAAVEALRVLEPDTWKAWDRNRLDWETLTTLEKIAPGGYTDIFAMGRVEGVYCDDLKSSYPFRYADESGMVAGLREVACDRSTWNDPHTVVQTSWFLDASIDGETVAPAKDAEWGLGAGNCTNWLTRDERVLLDEDCRVSRVRMIKAYGPNERLPHACKDFLQTLYRWKESGVFFAKVWINSLHGKFCENIIKDTWQQIHPRESFLGDLNPPTAVNGVGLWRYDKLSVDAEGFARPWYQPLCGALVYGRARADIIRIIRTIQRAGYRVFYCDTDSVFHNCPPDVKAQLFGDKLGNGLGQLSSEGGPYHGYILGRKLYYLENDDGSVKKIAAKGVPMKRLASGTRAMGVYGERSDGGTDLQAKVFQEIWESGNARILRTGVTPFVVGASVGIWDRYRMVRRLSPIIGNKVFDDAGHGHYMAGAV